MATINYTYLGQYAPNVYHPNFDPTGLMASNLVTSETHTVNNETEPDYHVIVPLFAPFFAAGLSIVYKPFNSSTTRTLVEGVDYTLAYQFIGATRGCAKPVYGGIALVNDSLSGNFTLVYQTLGGNWCVNLSAINEILANAIQNPRVTSWEQIVELPDLFPVVSHQWYLDDLVGASELVQAIDELSTTINETSIAGDIEGLRIVLESKLLELETKVHNYAASNTAALANISTNLVLDRADIEKIKILVSSNYVSLTDKLNLLNKNIDAKIDNLSISLDVLSDLVSRYKLESDLDKEDLINRITMTHSSLLKALSKTNELIVNNSLDISLLEMALNKTNTDLSKFKVDYLDDIDDLKDSIDIQFNTINELLNNKINDVKIDMLIGMSTLTNSLAVTNNIVLNHIK